MNDKIAEQDSIRTLRLMNELEDGEMVSQRELATRLGIAVGLVNSCLKTFIAKGYVRVKNYPRNRYAYLLTPKGLTEKSRIAYQHISYFTGLYTTTRRDYVDLFRQLANKGVEEVSFFGVDEVAEIAYLSLREVGLKLTGVHDCTQVGHNFLGYEIRHLNTIGDVVVISSLKRRDELVSALMNHGFSDQNIYLPGKRPS